METKNKIPDGVLIDEEDRPILESMGKWRIDSKGYCMKYSSMKLGKQKALLMHRVIMKPPEDMQIDHINGNRLDNRKQNLRIVTNQENQWNQTKAKGYYWKKSHKKWEARLSLNNKDIHIGLYDTEEDARNAYLEAKKIYHVIPERKQNATDSSDV